MNQKQIDIIAQIVVDGALEFMATKAGVAVRDIALAIHADEGLTGAGRYFADLVAAGMANAPRILAEGR
jgi:hypothetical protein